jgi:hypothetical protein
MIRVSANLGILKVEVSRSRNLRIEDVKFLIRKGAQIKKHNIINLLVIDIDKKTKINKSALKLLNQVVYKSAEIPIAIISS